MLTLNHSIIDQYPNLPFGIMIMNNLHNSTTHPALDNEKLLLEQSIRHKYGDLKRSELKSISPLYEYAQFYKRFKKTYHVQLQLESVALKNKSLPSVAAIVEAMFMAELKNQVLTAGYDLSNINMPVEATLSNGDVSFMGMGEKEKTPPKGDVIFKSIDTVLGSIICGPNHANRITSETKSVMFTVYGVPDITQEQIEQHFDDIVDYVKIVSPNASVENKIII